MGVRAHCKKCGLIFDVSHIFGGVGLGVGNATNCTRPGCDGTAEVETVVAGQGRGFSWEFVTEAATVLRDTNLGDLEEFRRLMAGAARGDVSHDEALSRAGAVDNRLEVLLEATFKYGVPAAGLVAGILSLVIALKVARSDDISHDELMQELRRHRPTMEQVQPHMSSRPLPYDAPPVQILNMEPRLTPLTGPLSPAQLEAWWNGAKRT